eukprot:GHVP01070441.1.p1 GENE.GHVP01070441.1~~GHVP01070441.1.p1  ORF type:complete len:220 (+),score=47.78 GHVP01070441.1:2-661(+)
MSLSSDALEWSYARNTILNITPDTIKDCLSLKNEIKYLHGTRKWCTDRKKVYYTLKSVSDVIDGSFGFVGSSSEVAYTQPNDLKESIRLDITEEDGKIVTKAILSVRLEDGKIQEEALDSIIGYYIPCDITEKLYGISIPSILVDSQKMEMVKEIECILENALEKGDEEMMKIHSAFGSGEYEKDTFTKFIKTTLDNIKKIKENTNNIMETYTLINKLS